MNSAICTLFEGNYHLGVAALTNSLYKNGFRGDIYVGYRGKVPHWAKASVPNTSIEWLDSTTYTVSDDLRLHFLPLHTDYHFTNYKPDFMLLLWDSVAKGAKRMYYFDPDIIVTSPWSFFEEWVECGIALCEDINSPLSEFHPRRVAWRQYFSKEGVNLYFKNPIYVNGGFIGLSHRDFLLSWKRIQELMAPVIGGLNRSSLEGNPLSEENQGPYAPFSKTDQDALNATVEAWDGKVSFIGQEGMAFKAGSKLMPHALGNPKPWRKHYIRSALSGNATSLADKSFWLNTESPIRIYSKTQVKLKRISIMLATFISRFYQRY